MTANTDPAVRSLLDKQEIHEVLMRYCRAVDRLDEALLRSVYHPDATDDHGMFSGPASEFVTWVMKFQRENFVNSIHSISNELVEIDGDVAHSESYFTGFHHFRRDGQDFTRLSCGRYIDRFERRDGAWKIARRIVVNDWGRVDPLAEPIVPITRGFRSREDPVYRQL
jgi:hypothetical protein